LVLNFICTNIFYKDIKIVFSHEDGKSQSCFKIDKSKFNENT
jgi:hypothetical protein